MGRQLLVFGMGFVFVSIVHRSVTKDDGQRSLQDAKEDFENIEHQLIKRSVGPNQEPRAAARRGGGGSRYSGSRSRSRYYSRSRRSSGSGSGAKSAGRRLEKG